MRERLPDLRLYVVTDRHLGLGRPIDQIVQAAISGGATMIQLRDKAAPTRELIAQASRLRELTRGTGVLFIVNDRVDVALAVGADGVHVGQEDMPVAMARSLVGPGAIVGATARNLEQARAAEAEGADYIGCNAVFATPTKGDTGEPLGFAGLTELVQATRLPVVAIGGVNATNAAKVMACGVAGLAVVSAVVAAENVCAAARELRDIVDKALEARAMPLSRGGTP